MSKQHKVTVANIQSYEMIGGNVASVVASTAKVETAQDYADKVSKLFKGKLEVIPGTVRDVSKIETAKAVAFHVRPVTESMPYDDNVNKMRTVVEANVFADEEDATWMVVEAQPGVKRLVKQTETDVAGLLAAASRQNMHRIAASYFDADVGTVHQGEAALFTNPETASVDSGVVTYDESGKMQILSARTGKLVSCSRDAIVAHAGFTIDPEEDGADIAAEYAGVDKRSAQGLITYFRKLFSAQPMFMSQLEQALRKRALLA